MRIGFKYYIITSKKIKEAFNEYLDSKDRMYRKIKAIARDIGADPTCFLARDEWNGSIGFRGFKFKVIPKDPTLFLKKKPGEGYMPRKNTWLYEEISKIPKISYKNVEDMVGWKDVWNEGYYYKFNPFYFLRGKHFGFRTPFCDNLADKQENYTPKVKGIKEITLSEYYKILADKEMVGEQRKGVRSVRGKKIRDKKRGNSNRAQTRKVKNRVHSSTASHPTNG
jgi:hypothetical protein